jgi:hypothetical protein
MQISRTPPSFPFSFLFVFIDRFDLIGCFHTRFAFRRPFRRRIAAVFLQTRSNGAFPTEFRGTAFCFLAPAALRHQHPRASRSLPFLAKFWSTPTLLLILCFISVGPYEPLWQSFLEHPPFALLWLSSTIGPQFIWWNQIELDRLIATTKKLIGSSCDIGFQSFLFHLNRNLHNKLSYDSKKAWILKLKAREMTKKSVSTTVANRSSLA